MSRNTYGMNSIGKDKPETEEVFGNSASQVEKIPCPEPLKKWMDNVKEFQEKEFRDSFGHFEEWRPRGSGDPKAAPKHYNKKDNS